MDGRSKSGQTRDVRFIVASDYESAEALMFRNEDMPWPPYFKFNSGDLSGKVMNIKERFDDALVAITAYGWRIPIFGLYPNATSVEVVGQNYSNFPWFNVLFLSSFTVGVLYLFRKVKIAITRRRSA